MPPLTVNMAKQENKGEGEGASCPDHERASRTKKRMPGFSGKFPVQPTPTSRRFWRLPNPRGVPGTAESVKQIRNRLF